MCGEKEFQNFSPHAHTQNLCERSQRRTMVVCSFKLGPRHHVAPRLMACGECSRLSRRRVGSHSMRLLPSLVVVGWEQGGESWPSPGSHCPAQMSRAAHRPRSQSALTKPSSDLDLDLDQAVLQGEAAWLPLLKLFSCVGLEGLFWLLFSLPLLIPLKNPIT